MLSNVLDYDCIILSGASGAVGSFVLKQIVKICDARVFCILRSQIALDRLVGALGTEVTDRVIPVFADLVQAEDMEKLTLSIGTFRRCLVIHCAGDVSWTKSHRLLAPINTDGTRHLAAAATRLSREKPSFVFLSTAYCDEQFEPRNAYESTKLAAEQILAAEFGDRLNTAVIRCSLIVGAREDGWIARFNGLYPLVRIIALAEVPCLIADSAYEVDTTPVDVVWKEILFASSHLSESNPFLRGICASGDASSSLLQLVELTSRLTNAQRVANGLPENPQISIVSERQFKFLIAASRSWGMEQRFSKVEEISGIMAGYIEHGSSGRRIAPRPLDNEVPAPETYLPAVVNYWLKQNKDRILSKRSPRWLVSEDSI